MSLVGCIGASADMSAFIVNDVHLAGLEHARPGKVFHNPVMLEYALDLVERIGARQDHKGDVEVVFISIKNEFFPHLRSRPSIRRTHRIRYGWCQGKAAVDAAGRDRINEMNFPSACRIRIVRILAVGWRPCGAPVPTAPLAGGVSLFPSTFEMCRLPMESCLETAIDKRRDPLLQRLEF